MRKDERITGFADAIWDWYARHKRELPWRDMAVSDDNERAYRVLVSEVMLQQTQVNRVKIVFKNFLERFTSLADLAHASNSDVIMAWRGMGYNSRALRLRDAAKSVVENYDGTFPREMNDLLSISGIGPYTAAAIRNFAFNIPTPCIDTNIRRILHRTFIGPEDADGTWSVSDKELLIIAKDVLDVACHPESVEGRHVMVRRTHHDTSNWHAALMDYGSLVQTKNNPKWDLCILTQLGLMKATPKNWVAPVRGAAKENLKKEPGRFVGSVYIPNRIFRGKIVEALRNEKQGLPLHKLGPIVCIDWEDQHREWLQSLITKLVQDRLISEKKGRFILAD